MSLKTATGVAWGTWQNTDMAAGVAAGGGGCAAGDAGMSSGGDASARFGDGPVGVVAFTNGSEAVAAAGESSAAERSDRL